jgi:hypothetical protein
MGMIKSSLEVCKSCKYGLYNGTNGGVICDYISITNHSRKCPVGQCDKYEAKRRKRKE